MLVDIVMKSRFCCERMKKETVLGLAVVVVVVVGYHHQNCRSKENAKCRVNLTASFPPVDA
jgi:hypothetical protein